MEKNLFWLLTSNEITQNIYYFLTRSVKKITKMLSLVKIENVKSKLKTVIRRLELLHMLKCEKILF